MLFGHASSAFVNGVLLAQCVYYYRATHQSPEEQQAAPGALTPLVVKTMSRSSKPSADR